MALTVSRPCSLGNREETATMAAILQAEMSGFGRGPASLLSTSGEHVDYHASASRSASLSHCGCLSSKLLTRVSVGSIRNASYSRRKKSGDVQLRLGCRCLGEGAWFELPQENSSRNGGTVSVGDFKILSHLRQLGCGDLTRKPQEVHFGGCMNEAYAFHCTGGNYFVKINRRFDVDSMFAGELEALAKMKATETIRVPTPLGCGSLSDGGSYLIMEHLHFRPFGMLKTTSQEALGRSLAQLHLADVGPSFGFPVQTRLGVLKLSNSWSTSWSEFFIENRLQERLLRAYAAFEGHDTGIQKKGDLVLERAGVLLKDYNVRPSLLHGDLWMGNAGLMSTGEVAIFDPACFIGDSEFDLAFQEWSPARGFPGLSEGFYKSYHELLPRAPGFDQRHKVYQLYHLLNHLLLYQVEYFQHVMTTMDKILMD